jgi:hypothetical protein
MKTTIIESKLKNIGINYPVIAKNRKNGSVVLFTSEHSGTLLIAGTTDIIVGTYHDGEEDAMKKWVSVKNEYLWEILDEITINFKS